jgi:hypothetical protein
MLEVASATRVPTLDSKLSLTRPALTVLQKSPVCEPAPVRFEARAIACV